MFHDSGLRGIDCDYVFLSYCKIYDDEYFPRINAGASRPRPNVVFPTSMRGDVAVCKNKRCGQDLPHAFRGLVFDHCDNVLDPADRVVSWPGMYLHET